MTKWDQALKSESPNPASGLSLLFVLSVPFFHFDVSFSTVFEGFFEVVSRVSGQCLILL